MERCRDWAPHVDALRCAKGCREGCRIASLWQAEHRTAFFPRRTSHGAQNWDRNATVVWKEGCEYDIKINHGGNSL
ncbi:hypothetical protein JTE90_012961 [Oedothorax gibbosus]|uniref:Uncharacterized protein n=1 Tax=Oedothorax gibbosus TaxID=931172 RepID=A0AAV6TEP5_9ARAC|nr:hypothetical protein JTE90_012961 [Oedothorax gibbosus]